MKVILFIVVLIISTYDSQIIKEDTFIIGRWSLVNINGLMGYSIPEMEFDSDGIGKIIEPSGKEVGFTYIILPYNKGIRFSFRGHQSYLDAKEYTYRIRILDDMVILKLTSKHNGNYTLKRALSN